MRAVVLPSDARDVKVLFLDIDGVLATFSWMRSIGALWDCDPIEQLDPVLGARLERVLQRTGAVIVVSSSWRCDDNSPPDVIESILRLRGVPSAVVVGATPDPWAGSCTGYEIQRWLDGHPEVTRFAIVDDENTMLHLAPRLVKTTLEHGLLDEHVERLVELLGERE